MPTPIDPKRIRTDLDTQSRIALNEETVKEYAEAMEAGAEFPAPLVFYDETNDLYILAEGFHRHASHMKVKPNDPILVELRLGTVEDARWASIGANKSHGLRRTNEDKRNAIKLAVTHPKGVEETDRGIAAHVGVDHKTVGNVRKELQASGEIPQIDTRTVYRGDQVYQQNTHGINFGRKAPPPGSTCATCRYFEQARCSFDGSEPVPWTAACDNFAVKVEDKPNSNFSPPDYDNIVISNEGDPDKKRKTTGRQNRKLAGCQLVPLPPDNAQLFAVELRNRFAPDYLVACFAALKTLLTDKES